MVHLAANLLPQTLIFHRFQTAATAKLHRLLPQNPLQRQSPIRTLRQVLTEPIQQAVELQKMSTPSLPGVKSSKIVLSSCNFFILQLPLRSWLGTWAAISDLFYTSQQEILIRLYWQTISDERQLMKNSWFFPVARRRQTGSKIKSWITCFSNVEALGFQKVEFGTLSHFAGSSMAKVQSLLELTRQPIF